MFHLKTPRENDLKKTGKRAGNRFRFENSNSLTLTFFFPTISHQQMAIHKTKRCVIKKSTIEGAGLGLFVMEPVKIGERVAIYSGKELDSVHAFFSKSKYLVQISKNVFLDAQDDTFGLGKFINCGNRAKKEVNARLGSKTTYNVDAATGIKWISVICTKEIKKGDEVFIDYGDTYWDTRGTSILSFKEIGPAILM